MKKQGVLNKLLISYDEQGEKEVSEQIMNSYNIGVVDSINHDPLQSDDNQESTF